MPEFSPLLVPPARPCRRRFQSTLIPLPFIIVHQFPFRLLLPQTTWYPTTPRHLHHTSSPNHHDHFPRCALPQRRIRWHLCFYQNESDRLRLPSSTSVYQTVR